jgi:hypothetical protein
MGTVDGVVCTEIWLGVVATKLTGSCALTPVALAVITAGPEVVEEIVVCATPFPSVVAVVVTAPPKSPRVVENDTGALATGTPAFVHVTETLCAAPRLMGVLAAGEVNEKLWALTDTVSVDVMPRTEAVNVSSPATVAVI